MDVVSRRRPGLRSSVAAGCVWESRMRTDESKGGVKVLNESKEESNSSSNNNNNNNNGEVKKVIGNAANGKRKAWRSESIDGSIQIGKKSSGGDEKVKELSASFDGGMIKKGTTGIKKGKREIEKSPIQGRKSRSEVTKVGSVMGIEKNKNLSELRKVKSDSAKLTSDGNVGKSVKVVGDGNEENSGALRKAKSMPENAVEECSNGGAYDEIGSDDKCEDLCVDQEEVKSVTEVHQKEDKDSGNAEDEEEFSGQEEEEEEEEIEDEGEEDEEEEELALDGEDKDIEIEKKSVETKEITVNEEETARPSDGVVSEVKKVEEVNVELPKPNTKPSPSPKPAVHDANEKPKPVSANNASKIPPNSVVKHTTRVHRNVANPPSPSKTSPVYKQPPPVTKRSPVYQNYAKPRSSHGYEDFPEKQSKLQNLADLFMWRDISKSAFVFGFGTFIIISSSYTKDVNISCISVISYLGLVYLALIFLYRSIICRGYVDIENNTNYVLGEEEAVWLLKLVLPYLNEFLVNIKALFSGDPATTMKLAVLLFVLARCGSSITIWKMAKLGFFAVFTLPKVCSSYSPQLTAYGNFWIRRFRDAWDSCSHKKAVAATIFTLIWNLCSVVARIWAVFMLFVAFRYYQRSIARDEWVENEQTPEDTLGQPIGGSRRGRGPTIVETSLKEKKAS